MAGTTRRTMLRRILSGIFGITLVGVVAGCSVGPSFNNPVFPFATSYGSHRGSNPVLLDNAAWWRGFKDPALNGLVDKALLGNLDLALATERVIQAQALAATVPVGASLSGNVDAGVQGGRGRPDETGAKAAFGLAWLFDPYGGRDAQNRAAAARVEVADAERDAARLLLLSNITAAYVDLRFQQRSLQLRRQELGSRRRTLDLVRRLGQGNAGTRLDTVRAEALVSETQALIPGSEAAIRVQKNRIAVLLGVAPGQVGTALTGGGGQPVATLPADIGIPADLLRNRPDIRITERLYYAAVAEIGVAQAALYPALSLGGEISLSAFGGARGSDYFFGPTLRLPALPNGPQRAQVRVRASDARQALTRWRSTVLGAIEDVESALVAYSGSRTSVTSARKTVRLRREAVALTRQLIARDGATIRDLLDAESAVASANILLSQNLRQLGRDFVVLNVSLGSGNGYGGRADAGSASPAQAALQ